MKNFLLILSAIFCLNAFGQTSSQRNSVLINQCVVSGNSITLNWNNFPGATYTIFRKLKSANTWGQSIGTTSGNSFTDNNISTGIYYEYMITRSSPQGTGYGYISSGKEIPVVDYRGKIILVVDNTFSTSLASEINQLKDDMTLDGWIVNQINYDRWGSSAGLRTAIINQYNTDPSNTKVVYLLGHLPVHYSGNLNPDGHGDHIGAWPCDGYYGEINGNWTDNVNYSNLSQNSKNHNDIGDGKTDQSDFPSSLELQVGRIDMFNLTAYGAAFSGWLSNQTETQAMSNYLTRSHNFKIKQWTPQFRGIMFDNFDDSGDPFAGSAYKSITSLVGFNNFTDYNPNTSVKFKDVINNNSYLWSYACGGGWWSGASNVGNTDEYAGSSGPFQYGGAFSMTFGSYFGDWDNMNNFLTAPLACGALTSVWSGIPSWYFHHMGMGDNIGYSTLVSQNNQSLYIPQNGGWQGQPYNRVHMNLHGDPTLRQIMITPPSNLQFSNIGGNTSFSWSPSPDGGILGYHIYEITSNNITRINTNLITSNTFSSNIPYQQGRTYMVRAVKLESSVTGTYYNMSLGTKNTTTNLPTNIVRISPKVWLSGPFNGSLMSDSLRVNNLIPLSSPYAGLGYVHTSNVRNESIQSSVLSIVGNNAIVDWVIVELRNPIGFAIVGSRTGLLQRDGDVVDMNGSSDLEFDLPPGNYNIAIKHRNHLGIMSSGSFNLSSTSTSIDFTSSTISLYGTNARNSQNSLWCGDVNRDNIIKYTGSGNDRDMVLLIVGSTNPNNSVVGYYSEDVNMDGLVKYTGSNNDRDPILISIGGTTPTNIRSAQLP